MQLSPLRSVYYSIKYYKLYGSVCGCTQKEGGNNLRELKLPLLHHEHKLYAGTISQY